ncbi:KdsC family phosphatase [Roseateles sp. DC23W]|uniref:KdsC family phosphatase n=1 Tax=Pelomonas dachongensis TaxID=3299029 RepID=A0ABW7EH17_9BURK
MAALSFPPELLVKAQGTGLGVKLALFDVDGVLTDGRIYIGANGEDQKAFSTLDGHGLKLLQQAGITPVIITGRDSPGVRRRVADLGLTHAMHGVKDKLAAATPLLAQFGATWGEVAAIGDDWPDLPLLARAGFAAAPPGAHAEARGVAHYITQAAAGYGAAREFCDLLLMAAGHYERLLRAHHDTLDGGKS